MLRSINSRGIGRLGASTTALWACLSISNAHGAAPPTSPETEAAKEQNSSVAVHGHVETYYLWNFARPHNNINNHRVADARHNNFALNNAVIDVFAESEGAQARIVLQSGPLPDSPVSKTGMVSGSASREDAWKFLQQAALAYRAPLGRGLLVEGGLFLWLSGPEGPAIHEQWNWSRSNLFNAMPQSVAGLRATQRLTERLSLSVGLFNGWTGVNDNNQEKSFAGQLLYVSADQVQFSLGYMGGVERDTGAPEGRAWRHMTNTWVQAPVSRRLCLGLQGNGGLERTQFGSAMWFGAAVMARIQPIAPLFLAFRADGFRQRLPNSSNGAASPVLFAEQGVVSATVTLDLRPHDRLSVRLEYRHDHSGSPLYYRGQVLGSGSSANPYEPNSYFQDSILLGATAWF